MKQTPLWSVYYFLFLPRFAHWNSARGLTIGRNWSWTGGLTKIRKISPQSPTSISSTMYPATNGELMVKKKRPLLTLTAPNRSVESQLTLIYFFCLVYFDELKHNSADFFHLTLFQLLIKHRWAQDCQLYGTWLWQHRFSKSTDLASPLASMIFR